MTDQDYDEFYKNQINIYKCGGEDGSPGGWAGYYYGIFSKIINENDFKICAEIGIGFGFHAREILETTFVERLYLVDPMVYYPNDAFPDNIQEFGGFELLVRNIEKHLKPFSDRYTWFRTPSLEIRDDQIPDGSLDAVFIDADHSYEAVSADLPFWWKKLRKGGWLLGDDYQSCFPGCTRAVDEFAARHNLPLEFLSKPTAPSIGYYPIYKFVKPS